MKRKYVYIVFKLNQKYYQNINQDLKRFGFKYITAHIPVISVLSKTIKKQDIYENIPMLFIYGFLRLPVEFAFDRYILEDIRRTIPGINAFLKTVQFLHSKKLKKRIDNADIFDDYTIANTVPRKDVKRLMKMAKNNEIYDLDSVTRIIKGDYLILRGYPFDGLEAIIQEIDIENKKVQVQILAGEGIINTKVDFQNIIYSVYRNFDEERNNSIPVDKLIYYDESRKSEDE